MFGAHVSVSQAEYVLVHILENIQVAWALVFATYVFIIENEIYDVASVYSSPYLSTGDMFQDRQWMPETMDSTESIYTVIFFLIHAYLWWSLIHKLGPVRD